MRRCHAGRRRPAWKDQGQNPYLGALFTNHMHDRSSIALQPQPQTNLRELGVISLELKLLVWAPRSEMTLPNLACRLAL
jgi:hypothetical protein